MIASTGYLSENLSQSAQRHREKNQKAKSKNIILEFGVSLFVMRNAHPTKANMPISRRVRIAHLCKKLTKA